MRILFRKTNRIFYLLLCDTEFIISVKGKYGFKIAYEGAARVWDLQQHYIKTIRYHLSNT